VLILGVVVISQLLLGWIPGLLRVWEAADQREWPALAAEIAGEWNNLATRIVLWWAGVRAGGGAQDNLVFGVIGSLLLWIVGALVARLARRTRQGYAAAAAPLWLLGVILLYSSSGRYLLITGVALAILLQLLLDHETLIGRWQALGLDYSPGILVDRVLIVLSAAVLVLTISTFTPNLYIRPLVMRYYQLMAPFNEDMEALLQRLFPDIRATSRLRSGGAGDGLPNEFLLQGGPTVTQDVVMRVRTNESGAYAAPYEEYVPPGHYMRGGTLSVYNGRGWRNTESRNQTRVAANQQWADDELWGRKLVVQSVMMEVASTVLYAAPEPVEVSTDARLDARQPGDLVAVLGRERAYTVVSAVPAVNEEMLRSLPNWNDETPLPAGYELHLALPDTVSDRTRELAAEITAGLTTAYDKAYAIEQFLRQYEYDLTVEPPPLEVVDVADYFLFDLQRGYCDYYATAFVVMARVVGLPARFATGFAVGAWNPMNGEWVVTEAEAHSWPEVYFPEIGWVAFEPTAGRATLARIASPEFTFSGGTSAAVPPPPALPEPATQWNWQMLLWLIPLGAAVWGIWFLMERVRRSQEDPWQALLAWGRRTGRPMAEGETVLEYGAGLADFATRRWPREPDTGRIVAREVQAMSRAVSTLRYGPDGERPLLLKRISDHWERMRQYMNRRWGR
jgi:transglutaminase-like putative cysteine protease